VSTSRSGVPGFEYPRPERNLVDAAKLVRAEL
jgi:hypothetical protein